MSTTRKALLVLIGGALCFASGVLMGKAPSGDLITMHQLVAIWLTGGGGLMILMELI